MAINFNQNSVFNLKPISNDSVRGEVNNPVYIKSRGIAKYVDAAYGWDWLDFDRMRKRHLEMTEISNFGNVIYLKPELDQIIRREYKTDK